MLLKMLNSRFTLDYVQQEILNTISLMQLNDEYIPDLPGDRIVILAAAFLNEWNEVGDYEADFDRTLLDYLRTKFEQLV